MNNLNELQQLSQNTIQLQHDTRLAAKKIDVVGVIQSKVNDALVDLKDALQQQSDLVRRVDPHTFVIEREQFVQGANELSKQQKAMLVALSNIIDKTDEINKSMTSAKVGVMDELHRQQETNRTQLTNLTTRIDEVNTSVKQHLKITSLENVLKSVDYVEAETNKLARRARDTYKHMENTLHELDEQIGDLRQKSQTVKSLNTTFEQLMDTMSSTLASIDDKVCQASPLYTGPSSDEIEASFRELATHDISELVAELRAGQSHRSQQVQTPAEPVQPVQTHTEPVQTYTEPVQPVQIYTEPVKTYVEPVQPYYEPASLQPNYEQVRYDAPGHIAPQHETNGQINPVQHEPEPIEDIKPLSSMTFSSVEIILPDMEPPKPQSEPITKSESKPEQEPEPKKKGFFARLFGGE